MKNISEHLAGFDDFINIGFHNHLWMTLLKLREKMIKRNLSLEDIISAIDKKEINDIDTFYLSAINNLSIYYDLFSVVAFKEQYEALLDLDMINQDEYQKQLISKFPNIDGCLEFLSYLRNNVSHAGLKISTFGDTVSTDKFSLSANELKRYLKSMIVTLLKTFKAYKITMATNVSHKNLRYVPFSGQKSLFESLAKSEGEQDFKFDNAELNSNKLMDKLLVIMASEKLNELTLTNPKAKWSEIKKQIIEFIGQYKGYPNFKDVLKMFTNDQQILDVDAMLYAQFVLSSKCYDTKYKDNYEHEIDFSTTSKTSVSEIIENIRNSVMHGMFEITKDNKILCKGLNSQGYTILKNVRKQKRRLTDKEVQAVLRNNPIFIDENVEDKVEISREDLLNLCNNIVEIYQSDCKKHFEEENE